MAGAGYKLFNTGDVLTAAQVNTYLMEQTVMVFADATARTTALSGVLAEGMVSYLQDTNAVQVYTGTAWVNVGEAGDITAVNVTSPITGGGSSGDVTIGIQDGTTAQKGAVQLEDSTSSTSTTKAATPNSVKSAYDLANAAIPKSVVDAAGDLLYATANDTVTRLALGTAGQVLKVNSGATAPEWGAAGGAGALTKITANLAFSGATSVSIDNCFTSTYTNYLVLIENLGTAANQTDVRLRFRTSGTDNTGASYQQGNLASLYTGTTVNENASNATSFLLMGAVSTVAAKGTAALFVSNPQTATTTTWSGNGSNNDATYRTGGQFTANTQFDGFKIYANENLVGNITVYGLEK